MELSRIISAHPLKCTVIFVTFDNEELGLYGSTAYADYIQSQGIDLDFMLNFDMIGYTNDTDPDVTIYHGLTSPAFGQIMANAATTYASLRPVLAGTSDGSDSWSFYQNGYDVLYTEEGDFNTRYHTPADTIGVMNFPYMTKVVKMGLATLSLISNSPSTVENLKAVHAGDGHTIYLSWNPNPPEDNIVYYNVYFGTTSGQYDSIHQVYNTSDTLRNLTGNTAYFIAVTAVSSDGLESVANNEVETFTATLDQGILLVDETYISGASNMVDGDSINAFYQRALQGYTYTYVDHSYPQQNQLHLNELGPYSVVIVHSEDERGNWSMGNEEDSTYLVLKEYLNFGGKVIIEGRRNLSEGNDGSPDIRQFLPGNVPYDYLKVKSTYVPYWSPGVRSEEFIGASNQIFGYPDLQVDSLRVSQCAGDHPLSPPLGGKVPGVGYIDNLMAGEVIYTFNSAYNSSNSKDKPVAFRYLGSDYKVIYFDFPLYFIQEPQAIELLHKALSDLDMLPVGTPTTPTGLRAYVNDSCDIALSWKPNPEGDVVKYRIYHKANVYPPVLPDPPFQIIDSVFVPDTSFVDTTINDTLIHYYFIRAIDNLGLESPMSGYAWASAGLYYRPDSIRVMNYTDTSATIGWSVGVRDWHEQKIAGCNIYRSLVSHDYTELEPINDTLLIPDSLGWVNYTDSDVTAGTTYYYTVTDINKCGYESEKCYYDSSLHTWLEASVLVGKPHPLFLKVRSGKQSIKLSMSCSDTDIKGYKIFRQESSRAFQVINPLCPDTIYTDASATAGVDYHYKAIAIDTSNLESNPSDSVEGCIMLFNQGMALVDMTYGMASYVERLNLVNSDSVNAFYQRALQGYDYTYIDHSNIESSPLTLFELSTHPIAIVHSEDQRTEQSMDYWRSYCVLEQYLDAGGALLIEGRRNLSDGYSDNGYQFRNFASGQFQHDYLNLDSAYIPEDWNLFSEIEEFVGANRTSQMDGYSQTVELDTFRVNHAADNYINYQFNGKLPGVGYFMPLDSSEVIYTFISAYDSSASNGKPVALKHITDSSAIIYFDFPLWFVKEEIATQILHKALIDLEKFASDTIVASENLTNASVFPNPFKPYKGHTSMTFDNLTAQVKIDIFTIIGERVCTLEKKDDKGRLSWNVTNSDGKKLASGVYIYRVTNNKGQQKISKFAVIR